MLSRRTVLFAVLALLSNLNGAYATEPSFATTISIQGMHCAGCAAKVAGYLEGVSGVSKAEVDATKANAVVTAKPNVQLSGRALWEAIEKAGYKPTKLVNPAGSFTAKPKS